MVIEVSVPLNLSENPEIRQDREGGDRLDVHEPSFLSPSARFRVAHGIPYPAPFFDPSPLSHASLPHTHASALAWWGDAVLLLEWRECVPVICLASEQCKRETRPVEKRSAAPVKTLKPEENKGGLVDFKQT
jgi:hypothetical protein